MTLQATFAAQVQYLKVSTFLSFHARITFKSTLNPKCYLNISILRYDQCFVLFAFQYLQMTGTVYTQGVRE